MRRGERARRPEEAGARQPQQRRQGRRTKDPDCDRRRSCGSCVQNRATTRAVQHSSQRPQLEPQPDVHIPPERVSQTLKRARQLHGVDLRTVAAILKIRDSHLDAIETGRYDSLPGPTYAVGFVRAYADYLGLDSEEVVRRFKQEVDGLDEGPMLSFPTPTSEGRIPGGALILISALLIATAYGVWYYLSEREQSVAELIQGVPEHLQAFVDPSPADQPAPLPPPAATTTDERPAGLTSGETRGEATQEPLEMIPPGPQPQPAAPTVASAETPPAAPAAEAVGTPEPAGEPAVASRGTAGTSTEEPAGTQTDAASADEEPLPTTIISGTGTTTTRNAAIPPPPAVPDRDEVAAVPDAPAEGQTFGEGETRIILRATQDSWVQVRDANDEIILARILRVGDSYRVPDQPGLTLLTGNAGGLQIMVDGAVLPPLGPTGTVRRDVPLEPERLLQGYSTR